MPFIPLPSDLNLAGPDGLKAVNDALRRLADVQTPAPVPAPVVQPAGNTCQIAYASGNLTLAAGAGFAADVPGATLTLTRTGNYLIHGIFYFVESGAGDLGAALLGRLVAGGTAQANLAVLVSVGTAGTQATVAQQWVYAGTIGDVVKLQGYKSAGTGASLVSVNGTGISALWIGP